MRIGKVVIPARMESERLPKKMMIEIMGRPMIEHVWRRACLALPNRDIVIATDSDLIASHMKSMGANIFKSEKPHSSGTSRVTEFAKQYSLDFAVILQGDEVLIRPRLIRSIFQEMSTSNTAFINVVSPLTDHSDLFKHDIVKCWVDSKRAIKFMFRGNPLREPSAGYHLFRAVNGLFALSKESMKSIDHTFIGIAGLESIEQLAIINEGIDVIAYEEGRYLPSVNTASELELALEYLRTDSEQIEIVRQMFGKCE